MQYDAVCSEPQPWAVAGRTLTAVSSRRVNESDPQKDILDYATPKALGGGPSSPGEGRARMIGSAVMFVGAGILMGNREADMGRDHNKRGDDSRRLERVAVMTAASGRDAAAAGEGPAPAFRSPA